MQKGPGGASGREADLNTIKVNDVLKPRRPRDDERLEQSHNERHLLQQQKDEEHMIQHIYAKTLAHRGMGRGRDDAWNHFGQLLRAFTASLITSLNPLALSIPASNSAQRVHTGTKWAYAL